MVEMKVLARKAVDSIAARFNALPDAVERTEVQQWTRWKDEGGGLIGEFPERQILNMGAPLSRLLRKKDPLTPEVEALVLAVSTQRGVETFESTNIVMHLLQDVLGELPVSRAETIRLRDTCCERFASEVLEPNDVLVARSIAPLHKTLLEEPRVEFSDGLAIAKCDDADLRRFQAVGYSIANRVFAGDKISRTSTCYATHTVRARRSAGVTFPPSSFQNSFEVLSLALKLFGYSGAYVGNVRTLTPYSDQVPGVVTSPPPFPGDGPLGDGQPGPFMRLTARTAAQFAELHARLSKACSKQIPVHLRWFAKGCHEHEHADRFLDLMISLESLVLHDLGAKDRGELRFRLSLRIGWLLGTDSASRSRLRKKAASFYDTRSQLVHGGKPPPSAEMKQQSDELEDLVRTTINKCLTAADVGTPVDWEGLVLG